MVYDSLEIPISIMLHIKRPILEGMKQCKCIWWFWGFSHILVPVHCLGLLIHYDPCLRLDSGMIVFFVADARSWKHTVDGSEILRSPVEVDSWNPIFFARFQKHRRNPGRIEKTTPRYTGFITPSSWFIFVKPFPMTFCLNGKTATTNWMIVRPYGPQI